MDQEHPRRPYWRRAEEEEAEPEAEAFQERYGRFSDRVERFLTQLVVLGLVALALVQTLHTNTTARRMLNLVEGLEGIPWNQVAGWTGDQRPASSPVSAAPGPLMLTVVSVTRKSAPQVKLLIDGRAAGTFASGSVTVPVRPGQTIAVDGRSAAEPLTFRVVGPPELLTPSLGASVTTQGDLKPLGSVKIAD